MYSKLSITEAHALLKSLNDIRKVAGGEALFAVPNDEEGQEFLRLLRLFLRKGEYRLRLKARGKDRAACAASIGRRLNSHHDMPISTADYYMVYIDKKKINAV